MARGLLYVETAPASPADEATYHAWYEVHLRELLAVDGVVAARRYRILDDDGTYAALYDLEGDDLQAVRARISELSRSGRATPPQGTRTDPPPRVRLLELLPPGERGPERS